MEELDTLSTWLEEHDSLKTIWPFDEIEALITGVCQDGRIDPDEQAMLLRFFGEFTRREDHRAISPLEIDLGTQVISLCAVSPEVTFEGRVFCFTGASSRVKRKDLAKIVTALGGEFTNTMAGRINYLVVGAEGNPCWAYACYGRKVEHAVQLRRQGLPVVIVHENDFWDAVADAGVDVPHPG